MRALGWQPQLSIREGVLRTLRYLRRTNGCWRSGRDGLPSSGLWHLGCVTAACLADAGHTTSSASTPMTAVVMTGCAADTRPSRAWAGRPDPGKASRLGPDLHDGFARRLPTCERRVGRLRHAGGRGRSRRRRVRRRARGAALSAHGRRTRWCSISSQVPVGTTGAARARVSRARARTARVHFAYSPENLRLGQAPCRASTQPDRVVVGVRDAVGSSARSRRCSAPVTDRIEWMSVESAEMTKHALNAFLATSA